MGVDRGWGRARHDGRALAQAKSTRQVARRLALLFSEILGGWSEIVCMVLGRDPTSWFPQHQAALRRIHQFDRALRDAFMKGATTEASHLSSRMSLAE